MSAWTALREDTRSGGGRRERIRSGLVIFEIVASVVLLVSAGLLIRALWKVQAIDPGFSTDGRVTMRTALPLPQYRRSPRARRSTRECSPTFARYRVSPGPAYVSWLPLAFGGGIWPVSLTAADAVSPTGDSAASLRYVTPGYFAAMGIPLKQGRDLSETDTRDHPFVAVVSESFVRRHLAGRQPIGQLFHFVFNPRTIVGVVDDVKVRGLERTSEPQVYLRTSRWTMDRSSATSPKDLVVKASVPAAALVPPLRDIIRRADPRLPISDVRTMSEVVELQTAPRTTQIRVLGAFAAVALLLAGIGIHGVLAFPSRSARRRLACAWRSARNRATCWG